VITIEGLLPVQTATAGMAQAAIEHACSVSQHAFVSRDQVRRMACC